MKLFNFKTKKQEKTAEHTNIKSVTNNSENNLSNSPVHDEVFLELLNLFERANHYIKEGNWYESDRAEMYALKDRFLTIVYNNIGWIRGAGLQLFYVPYYLYSRETKDEAGAMMRADNNRMPFEYYLSQLQPSVNDIEIPEKATIEMRIEYKRFYSFHIPQHLISRWGLNINNLERKIWINDKEFHSRQFKLIKEEAKVLLSKFYDGTI